MVLKKGERGIQYPSDFGPIADDDVALNVNLCLPGFYLFHILGEWEQTCWCEPTLERYDEELDICEWRHRIHQ